MKPVQNISSGWSVRAQKSCDKNELKQVVILN